MIERVQAEMREAMRGGRRERRDALRLMLSALQRAAGERARGEFGDEDAHAVLRRERKARAEAAAAYRAAGDEERAAREEADIPVIEEFLPASLGEDELARAVEQAVADTGAAGMRDMGRVMGRLKELTGGRADGAAAAALVRARLGGGGG